MTVPELQKVTGLSRVSGPYRAGEKPENNLANSTRIESLMRAGNLYLSIQDAIALALENNLDIAKVIDDWVQENVKSSPGSN